MADTNLYSINRLPCNGLQTTFEISFAGGYINRSHVKAYSTDLNGKKTDLVFQWVNDFTIEITPALASGLVLTVYRDTPKDLPLADFTNGAVLTETSLDLNAKQAVFIAAEAQDAAADSTEFSIRTPAGGFIRDPGFVMLDAAGKPITQPYLPTIIASGAKVYDDGAWGGDIIADGIWG